MDIIDCHIHAQTDGNYQQQIHRLISHMLRHNIGKAVISDLGDGWKAFPDSNTLITANERVRQAAINSDGRLEYLVYINPQLPDWETVFNRFISNACGVKLWISLRSQEHGLQRTKDVLKKSAAFDKAVLIHTFDRTNAGSSGEIGIADIIELSEAVPDCRIIAAHAGGNWRKTISMASKIPDNVVFDISGGYPERTMIDRLLKTFGNDRILYGSDAFGRSFGSQLNKIIKSTASQESLQKILCTNSAKIFKLSGIKPVPPQNIPQWNIPAPDADHFCFVGKGEYWDHEVTPQMLVKEAANCNVNVLYAASLDALTCRDKYAANLRHKESCRNFSQIKPLAAADLNDLAQSLKILENASGFAGVIISPYLHNYQLDYQKYAVFFDTCCRQNIPIWINTALSDDRFRDERLQTRTVSVEEIISFAAQAPVGKYIFQGVPADINLSKKLPEHCCIECSKLSDMEYAPEELFEKGVPERLVFGSEYPFRDYSSVQDVLCGRV